MESLGPKTKREFSDAYEGSSLALGSTENFDKHKKSQTPVSKNVRPFREMDDNNENRSYTARYMSKETDSIGRISKSESEQAPLPEVPRHIANVQNSIFVNEDLETEYRIGFKHMDFHNRQK